MHAPMPTVDTAEQLDALYRPIRRELNAVEERIRGELRSPYAFVDDLVRYGCLLGGKRLRPSLLLLSGQAVGRVGADHITLATVVELIHTATLVHDDVLDQAVTRRHLATINARWDTEASVLLGDYLFTHAFHLASWLESPIACRIIGQATNRVCEGELRQKGNRGDWSLSEREYVEIIEAKTAALCAASCRLGAHTSGGTEDDVQRLADYGRCLGIAFQIADDLLDVEGEEAAVGKSLGTDLEQQKPTLPLIRLLQVCEPSDRPRLTQLLGATTAARDGLVDLLHRYGALEYARDRAIAYAEQAALQLESLPDSASVRALRGLTGFVIERSA